MRSFFFVIRQFFQFVNSCLFHVALKELVYDPLHVFLSISVLLPLIFVFLHFYISTVFCALVSKSPFVYIYIYIYILVWTSFKPTQKRKERKPMKRPGWQWTMWHHQPPITMHDHQQVFQTLSMKIHSGNYHWQRWLSTISASIT